jgi:hypothetical protein
VTPATGLLCSKKILFTCLYPIRSKADWDVASRALTYQRCCERLRQWVSLPNDLGAGVPLPAAKPCGIARLGDATRTPKRGLSLLVVVLPVSPSCITLSPVRL